MGQGSEDATPDALSGEVTLPVADGGAPETGQLGRFQVRRALGAGGMGVVLEADDPELGRRVAIKVLHVGDGSRGQVRRGRLLREARAAARLSHPNVITIHDVGTLEDGHPFIAMELVEGQTLAQWQRAPRPWREVIDVYLQAARGLAAAHEAGLVHRDFKPDNVLLGKHGAVKVSDFGIAAAPDSGEAAGSGELSEARTDAAEAAAASETRTDTAAAAASETRTDTTSDLRTAPASEARTAPPSPTARGRLAAPLSATSLERLTVEGEILGTPAFMAPEQRTSAAVDERADQYAFCVALYHALTGELPFGEDPATRAERAAVRRFVAPRRGRPGPRALYALVERGLSPRPADRFPSMGAVIAALERVTARRRRVTLAASLLAATLLAAAVLFLLTSRRDDPTCGGADEALALSWNDRARRELSAGFSASGLPDAAAVAARTSATVDRWGAEWKAAHLEACRATRVHHAADDATLARRMACLTSQREVLGGIVTALRTADRELAGKSPELVVNLPRLAECAAPPPLEASATAPAARAELRRQLDATDAAITIGKMKPARDALEQILAAARAAGDRELEAIALLRLGRMQRRLGDQAAAATTLFDAAIAAEALRRDDLATEAWADLIYVRRNRDASELADAERRALAALARAGTPPYLEALLINNLGVVRFAKDDFAGADAQYRRAIELRERMWGPRDPRVADVLDNMATNFDSWGNQKEKGGDLAEAQRLYGEARRFGERGLAIREEAFGADHPAIARSVQNLSLILAHLHEDDGARALTTRALRIKEKALGPEHLELTTTLHTLADFDESEGKLEDALTNYRRSLAIIERATGQGSPQTDYPLTAIAEILDALGRPAEAAPLFRRLAKLRDGASGTPGSPGSPGSSDARQAATRAVLSEVAAGAPLPAARLELNALIAADRAELDADDPNRAPILLAAARLDLRAKDTALAADRLAQVERLQAMITKPIHAQRADLAVTRAELDRARGKLASAREHAKRAAALCAKRDDCLTAGVDPLRRAEALLRAPI